MADSEENFDMEAMVVALNGNSRLAPEDRLELDTALGKAAEEMASTDPCNFTVTGICRHILAEAQWERMSNSELALYKSKILDFVEWVLRTFPRVQRVQDEQHRAGLQACKIVEDMARRCMQFNDTHLFVADVQMLTMRQTVPLMSVYSSYSQETDVGLGWLYKRVTQPRHELQE